MPVVTTMFIMAILGDDSDTPLPFFDTELLAESLTKSLAAAPDEMRRAALDIVNELEHSLADYRASVDTSLDAYIEFSADRYAPADELIERIGPLDRKRAETLRAVIGHRQALLELLDEQQWEATFGTG